MTDEEVRAYIDVAVNKAISEIKKSGLMKDSTKVAYDDAIEILITYYSGGKTDMSITYAIQGLRFDPYFRIIPMYFEENKTIEAIASVLGVDVSTVMRNKKRLCLAIYNQIV